MNVERDGKNMDVDVCGLLKSFGLTDDETRQVDSLLERTVDMYFSLNGNDDDILDDGDTGRG